MGSAVVSTALVGVPSTIRLHSRWRTKRRVESAAPSCSARRRTERPGRSRSPLNLHGYGDMRLADPGTQFRRRPVSRFLRVFRTDYLSHEFSCESGVLVREFDSNRLAVHHWQLMA